MPNQKEKYSLNYIDSFGNHHDISFSPREYRHLMELIWDSAIEDWGDCKGRAWCGSCHIKLNKLKQALPDPDAEENHCLGHQSNREAASRLACQLLLTNKLDGAMVTYLGDS